MKKELAKIIENKKLIDNYYVMTLESPEIAKEAMPGQFINIKPGETDVPLLRRPISIYDADKTKGILKILYFTKGSGTNLLKIKKPGNVLDLTGPHGRGFSVDSNSKNLLLVGGGFGTAPLTFLAKKNMDKNIFVAIGGRTEELILCEEDFKCLNTRVYITTDDGSYGEKGLVTFSVEKIITENNIDEIFTVGPIPMMKAVAKIGEEKNIPVFVSMEEKMACGVGTCFGCVCGTKDGYKTVCEEGPTFNSKDVF